MRGVVFHMGRASFLNVGGSVPHRGASVLMGGGGCFEVLKKVVGKI